MIDTRPFHVEKGEPITAAKTNAFQDFVGGHLPTAGRGIGIDSLGSGSVIRAFGVAAANSAGVTETGGWRVPCINRDSRKILPMSVVQVADRVARRIYSGEFTNPNQNRWPAAPKIEVMRPRETGLSNSLAWVDKEIEGDGEGTCILGGVWVVRIQWRTLWEYILRKVGSDDYPRFFGSDPDDGAAYLDAWHTTDAGLPLRSSLSSQKDSFVLWDLPGNSMGPLTLLWARYYSGDPGDQQFPYDQYTGNDQTLWLGLVRPVGW